MKNPNRIKVIVDANIVFSAILKSKSNIGDLLINHHHTFEFIAPHFLKVEIAKHHNKLARISGLTLEEVQLLEFQISKGIAFVDEEEITQELRIMAQEMVADIDEKDTIYVAYSIHFDCEIWSGDKALIKGLGKEGGVKFITTNDLLERLGDISK